MAGLADAAFQRLLATIKNFDGVKVPVGDTFAVVDEDDFEKVSSYKWHLALGYARAHIDGRMVPMHRFLFDPSPMPEVDHKDGNRLNNRRSNLRACNRKQNSRNRTSSIGRSKFKGVRRDRGQWRAEIKVDGKTISLGFCSTERLAARLYDAAAIKYFGDFARTNEALGRY
jgi:hypothetical protein